MFTKQLRLGFTQHLDEAQGMQALQSNAEVIGELISGSVEVRFERIKNIVERNPRRARLNCYPNLSAKSIQAVIEVVLHIEQQDSIAVHTRPNIRADLPKDTLTGLHETIRVHCCLARSGR